MIDGFEKKILIYFTTPLVGCGLGILVYELIRWAW